MLSGEGNENGEKTTIGLVSKKPTLVRAPHYFCTFICRWFTDYNVKLTETSYLHVFWRKCRALSFLFAHFYLVLVAASISHVVILHSLVCLWCGGTVGGGRRRSVYGHVITKFSGIGRFTYPWCSTGARFARARAPL